jgi:hypothetical protein
MLCRSCAPCCARLGWKRHASAASIPAQWSSLGA